MNILVLGSLGQLGSELQSLSPSYPFSFFFTDKADLDITDTLALESYLTRQPLDYIINCSAYTQVDYAEDDPDAATLINQYAVANLARLAARYSVKLIHISTDYVFDGTACTPYREDTAPHPINVYGQSKYAGEQAILASGCTYTIIRTSWLYSTFGNNFVKTMLRLQRERTCLSVVIDQIGSPTYAGDLASVILELIISDKAKVSNIYHYSNEGVCSWYDFALAICELSGNSNCHITPCRSEEYPTRAARPSYSVLDKTKIRATLASPIPHWHTSLQKCIKQLVNPQPL